MLLPALLFPARGWPEPVPASPRWALLKPSARGSPSFLSAHSRCLCLRLLRQVQGIDMVRILLSLEPFHLRSRYGESQFLDQTDRFPIIHRDIGHNLLHVHLFIGEPDDRLHRFPHVSVPPVLLPEVI